mmetsp:Transcript_61781/g.148671  ORF Transcript_61781/g.148671 Transcript_61781/m.148671 type:complete len:289 (-) Transcript_61781:256-1122(-)
MRLRGTLQKESQRRLQEIVKCLDRMSKGNSSTCIVILSPDSMSIASSPGGINEAQAWATLRTVSADGTGVFSQLRIESMQENKIGLEVEASLLILALKSADSGEQTTIKLRNKDGRALLSFEVVTQSIPMMTVIQDVPVRVLSAQQVDSVQEPVADSPTVRLMSPPIKSLSTVVERLKCLHDRILLKGNMNGELEIGVATDMAFMTTFWKDLPSPTVDGEGPQPRDSSKRAEAYVDAATLSRVFTAHSLKPSQAICCMMDQGARSLVVWLLFMGASDCVTYYMPVLDA